MYHVSAQGSDECMINIHCCYLQLFLTVRTTHPHAHKHLFIMIVEVDTTCTSTYLQYIYWLRSWPYVWTKCSYLYGTFVSVAVIVLLVMLLPCHHFITLQWLSSCVTAHFKDSRQLWHPSDCQDSFDIAQTVVTALTPSDCHDSFDAPQTVMTALTPLGLLWQLWHPSDCYVSSDTPQTVVKVLTTLRLLCQLWQPSDCCDSFQTQLWHPRLLWQLVVLNRVNSDTPDCGDSRHPDCCDTQTVVTPDAQALSTTFFCLQKVMPVCGKHFK